MDVHLVVRDAQILHREHRYAGEGFVDLEQVDIGDIPSGLGQHLADRADRGGGEVLGFLRMRGQRDDPGDRGLALGLGDAFARQHHGGGPVGDRGGGRGGDRAILGEGGLQRRDLVGAALGRCLVGVDHGVAGAGLDRDRRDFADEFTASDRRLGAGQRFDRIGVLLLAGQLIGVGGVLRESAHRAARLVGIFQPVEEHVVIGHVVADPRAGAVLLEDVGGERHVLHAPGNGEVDRAGGQRLGGHDDRLHARTADLVDRGRLNRLGQPGLQRGLTGRGLTEASGQHAAHVEPLDLRTLDTGALDRRLDRRRAQFRRGHFGQRARHRPHRGAGIGQDDDRISGRESHGRLQLLCTCSMA